MDVRDLFPLTLAHLGERAPAASDIAEFVTTVCAQHAAGDIPSRAVRDLAHYEALLQELTQPHRPHTGSLPRDDEPIVIAPNVRLFVFGAALPEMLAALREGKPARSRPMRGWIIAWREPGGALHEHLLLREEGWVLERFREPAAPRDELDDGEREDLEALWALGILQPAKR